MSKRTTISWTDATWNPWVGCAKVSEGCRHCYMFREAKRYGADPLAVRRTSPRTFNAPLHWHEPRKVFVCSWSDFFHPSADKWRDEAYEVMARAPLHTYQVVTKRPGSFADHWRPDCRAWLGVSVEDQRRADERVPLLLEAPAVARWVSVEPMLGSVTLPLGLDWVVVGGESGPGHRVLNLDHLASLVAQCRAAGVPIWVKQDSGPRPGQRGRTPPDLWIQEWPMLCGDGR